MCEARRRLLLVSDDMLKITCSRSLERGQPEQDTLRTCSSARAFRGPRPQTKGSVAAIHRLLPMRLTSTPTCGWASIDGFHLKLVRLESVNRLDTRPRHQPQVLTLFTEFVISHEGEHAGCARQQAQRLRRRDALTACASE